MLYIHTVQTHILFALPSICLHLSIQVRFAAAEFEVVFNLLQTDILSSF